MEDLALEPALPMPVPEEPTLLMPSPGTGAGTIYPSQVAATPLLGTPGASAPPAGPSASSEVDLQALVAQPLQSQIDGFSGAVQNRTTSNVVDLVQNTMGTALGVLDEKVDKVASSVTIVDDRVDGLSSKLDTVDATQKQVWPSWRNCILLLLAQHLLVFYVW